MLRNIASLLLLLLPTLGFSQNPWINEIHYDNSGGDVNEGVEIAGPAGTNLACYQVIPYNGSNGASYSITTLSGTIPDEGCGYGAIWFPISGLQNGAPDGIALYNTCTSTVIEFLSYEGAFTASNGAASGVASTNIGVSETGSTPVGQSLQLTGSGNTSGAFTWSAPSASSQGSLNTGQTITPCGGTPNTITTGAVSGGPFTVDCTNSLTDAGTVAFTSTGTFNGPNVYTVELSDETGSFASPTTIGTLASTANSGSIPITIPSTAVTGVGYLIRIVSDDPAVTGSNSTTAVNITQSDPCTPTTSAGTGLIINEWSNGPSGNQEFYEFVVAGDCGTIVDIRGYILDDNNGTFTTPADYSGTASGIAPGHFRFSNAGQWGAIPVGSLIVVYNAQDPNPAVPADDPTDANNDSLYVVPHTSTLFERCTVFPASTSPDSVYSPCTYAAAPLGGWNPLSLRNSGDAIQVRNPDGSYYHGVSYGGSEISGGPNNLKLFTGSGSGMMGLFNSGDFFDVSNWSSATVASGSETPGLPNNAANLAWLQLIRDPSGATCPISPLPVELHQFDGKRIEEGNLLFWNTQTELNSSYFTLERSIDLQKWELVSIEPAAGNSQSTLHYSTIDKAFTQGRMNYYRLSQTDLDGSTEVFGKIVALDNSKVKAELVTIVNLLGQEIDEDTRGVQIHVYSDGTTVKVFKQ
jgi:hypothetical protein